MDETKYTLEKFQKQDSEGFTFNVGKCTLADGEIVDCPPEFSQLKPILDNLDKLEIRDDDVWLASYSKAGTHWLYEIMHMLVNGTTTPAEHHKGIGMLEHSKGIDYMNQLPSPRILNSHMRVRYLLPVLGKTKVVHVARNPKSVAVSYYYHTSKVEDYEYKGTFHSYLPTYIQGYHTLYGNWFEYMKDWWDLSKGNDNIYFIFYEDLKKDPETEIKKLATFLGHDYDDKFISDVAKMTSFDAMAKAAPKPTHGIAISANDASGKSRFARKGIINDWKNHFTVTENENFDELYDREMKGYEDLKARIKFN